MSKPMEAQDSVNHREWTNPSNWLRGRYSSAIPAARLLVLIVAQLSK